MMYKFISTTGELIQMEKFTNTECQKNVEIILKTVNLIPYIEWDYNDLISQSEDYYNNKWNYSYLLKNSKGTVIGIMIAYFRIADKRNIFDSLYLHRFAIMKEYQNIGIGTTALKYFIRKAFVDIPWLLNITLQTNNNAENRYVIEFYRKNGFKDMYQVKYPNKVDILFLLERKDYDFSSREPVVKKSYIRLKHPRLITLYENDMEECILPIVYFASSNERKKEIVEFIFRNYNIRVEFVSSPIEITEPQVESPEDEQKLVSMPLKSISRFIKKVPYVIEDTMLFIEYFNRNEEFWELPGLDTKRWLRQLGLDGILDIMGDTKKRNAKFVSQSGAYIKTGTYCFGRGETYGKISFEKTDIVQPKYGTYPFFFHRIFIPDGSSKTLAEMDMYEYAQYDYMRKGIVRLIESMAEKENTYRQYSIFDYYE